MIRSCFRLSALSRNVLDNILGICKVPATCCDSFVHSTASQASRKTGRSGNNSDHVLVPEVNALLMHSPVKETNKLLKINQLIKTSPHALDTLQYLQENNVNERDICRNYWLLLYRREALKLHAAELLNLLQLGKSDIRVVLPLVRMPLDRMKRIVAKWRLELQGTEFPTRIHYMANKLNCKYSEVVVAMGKFLGLLEVQHDKVERVLNILLDYRVEPESILRDPWVFAHNEELLEERLAMAAKVGVAVVKPWMGRSPNHTFQNTLKRRQDAVQLLGDCSDVEEYLMERLQCDEEFIEKLKKRNPRVPIGNVAKLRNILDYIYSEGYTPAQVCQASRILCQSLDTTRVRLEELKAIGHRPLSLNVLCRSAKQYEAYVDKLVMHTASRCAE